MVQGRRRPAALRSRQCIRSTSLDDEWIVRIGQAWHRIPAAEIPAPCRAEEFGRRSAHDCAEIMDQVRLVTKAAGVCDIRPAKAALPRSDDLFDPRQSRILFRADPECCAKAARQVRSEEHTSELQSHVNLVCRLLLEKKKTININQYLHIYDSKKIPRHVDQR